jgi:transcriptional regulator with XRE-family HTH domain
MPKKRPNPVDEHVGRRLRMRRLMLDMSQAALANALGLTFQQVQKYEKGMNRVGASRLQHIAQILQVPVPFFFEGAPAASVSAPKGFTEKAESPAYVNQFLATSDGLALIKAFASIPSPKIRRSIVGRADRGGGCLKRRSAWPRVQLAALSARYAVPAI